MRVPRRWKERDTRSNSSLLAAAAHPRRADLQAREPGTARKQEAERPSLRGRLRLWHPGRTAWALPLPGSPAWRPGSATWVA